MSENKVLAVVKGKEITEDTLNRFLNDLGPQVAMQFQSEEGREKLIDELIRQEVLYLNAIEKDFDKDEEFVTEFEKIKENFLKQYTVNKMLRDVTVTEEEVKEFYENNKEMFKKPETAVASHILVEEEEKAKEIIKELEAGKSFEEAALEFSTCPSKDQGGNLGEFMRGQMVGEFEEAAFEMEEGSVSKEPVKTQFGYHIIKLINKNEESISSFDEVKQQLTQQVMTMNQQKEYIRMTDELKGKYEIEIK